MISGLRIFNKQGVCRMRDVKDSHVACVFLGNRPLRLAMLPLVLVLRSNSFSWVAKSFDSLSGNLADLIWHAILISSSA